MFEARVPITAPRIELNLGTMHLPLEDKEDVAVESDFGVIAQKTEGHGSEVTPSQEGAYVFNSSLTFYC